MNNLDSISFDVTNVNINVAVRNGALRPTAQQTAVLIKSNEPATIDGRVTRQTMEWIREQDYRYAGILLIDATDVITSCIIMHIHHKPAAIAVLQHDPCKGGDSPDRRPKRFVVVSESHPRYLIGTRFVQNEENGSYELLADEP